MIYVYIIFLFILGLFLPKFLCILYLIMRYSTNNIQSKNLIFVDVILSIYMSLSLSKMLADRPYYIGEEAGFGHDMYHYYNAFEWVGSTNFVSFLNNFSTITQLTGSSEPLFWFIVKLITIFFTSGYFIHFILTFLGCMFIYLAGQVWNKCGLLFLFFYTNTITFFAFQGSAIRSGLAFSFAMLGYALIMKNKLKIINFMSPFIHFSMIPIPLIAYAGRINYRNIKNVVGLIMGSIALITIFYFIAVNSTDAGLGAKATARLSENDIDITSIIQFFVESIITIFFAFYLFKRKIDNKIKISFLIFFLFSVFLLLLSPTAFSRFYRYEYIFLIFIYASIFLNSDKYIRLIILFSSFSWLVFLGFDRYIGVFGNSIFDFIGFNLFYGFSL